MINGTMYTVEDRDGSGIENNRGRVDIFVPKLEEIGFPFLPTFDH